MTIISRTADLDASANAQQASLTAAEAAPAGPGSPQESAQLQAHDSASAGSLDAAIELPDLGARTHTIPVIEERFQVGTRLTDTGRGVRIHKTVTETPHTVEQALLHDELQVQRLPQDRVLDPGQVPQTRYEGDTLIIPVVEEVLVLQKQLRLTEEIRITRVRTPVMSNQTVMLKSERIELERFEEPGARSDGGRPPQ